MRQIHPKLDCMKANSFQESEAETEGKDVMPNKIAKTKAKTPAKQKFGLFKYNRINKMTSVNWCHKNI